MFSYLSSIILYFDMLHNKTDECNWPVLYSFTSSTLIWIKGSVWSGTCNMRYVSQVLSSDKTLIYSFLSFSGTTLDSPWLFALNVTNGSPISQLYRFSVTWDNINRLELKDSYLYANWKCDSKAHMFIFDVSFSTFKFFYFFTPNLTPYYSQLDMFSDR